MVGRIRIGKQSDASYGLRISQAGYDVSTDPPDDELLIFNSDWPEVMPVHQSGSFTHRATSDQGSVVTQNISYPALGFIPFVDFVVRGNGDAVPSGTDYYPSNRYYERTGMTQILFYYTSVGGGSAAYLRLNITSTQIHAESYVRNVSGSSVQMPRTWTVYYVVYRKQAF
jgi:hypothetical protein